MGGRYVYKGTDITLDVLMKIEHIVRIIAEKESLGFDACYEAFINSRTYVALQNTETTLWAENAEFIADEYYRELEARG